MLKEKEKEVQEVINLISKLDKEQKKIILATLRGAVLIADCEKEVHNDNSRD